MHIHSELPAVLLQHHSNPGAASATLTYVFRPQICLIARLVALGALAGDATV